MAIRNEEFYNSESISLISHRGYYPEKVTFIENILSALPRKTKNKILDIACNDGVLTTKYMKYGEVVGLDINEKAIKTCKRKGITALCQDVSELGPKYNNFFDVVIAGDIIEHIFDSDTFLENIYRVMKPNGRLILTTPNVASLPRRLMLLLGYNPFLEYSLRLPTKEYNVGHVRYYTKKDLIGQLVHFNFKIDLVYGDKINTGIFSINGLLPRLLPSISRNFMVQCHK